MSENYIPPWIAQEQLDVLVQSGFAEIDEDQTQRNKEYWAMTGGKWGDRFLLRTMYRWTTEGKWACRLYRFTTPMSYAESMRFGNVRHCVHCGRCTAREKVGARWDRGSKQQRNRTVCVGCHRAGRQLETANA